MRTIFLICFLCSSTAFSQVLPLPSSRAESSENDVAVDNGMVWNKWETKNFIILSIDFNFGRRLKSRIEGMKSESCKSWGIDDKDFPVKCKVVCVPDPSVLKKFFSLDSPKFEYREDPGEMAIWLDEDRSSELNCLIVSACLYESPDFIRKGLPMLICLPPSKISELIISSEDDSDIDFSNDLSPGRSALFCLFFRKEFGSLLFSEIASGRPPFSACGFSSEQELSQTIQRYSDNLKRDLRSGRTPDSYLKLLPPKYN